MSRIILRNDDINANTDLVDLQELYDQIRIWLPGVEIWSCVSLMAQQGNFESVYADVPFKHQGFDFFMKADEFMPMNRSIPGDVIASHGLYHLDHTRVIYVAAEMSILSSCRFLKSKKFVAPFNAVNDNIEAICEAHGIELSTTNYPWKSLEYEPFDPNHKYWYFHSWKIEMKRMIEHEASKKGNRADVGQF